LNKKKGRGGGGGEGEEGGREEGVMEKKWNGIETHDSCAM